MGKECFIGIDKSIPMGCIIPASEVVQPRFLIEDVSAITERIANAERVRKRTGRTQQLTPCIVLVFYNKIASAVKDADDVALEVMEVGVGCAVEVYLRGAGLRIIEEVELISMLDFIEIGVVNLHVRKQLAVVGIIRGEVIDDRWDYSLTPRRGRSIPRRTIKTDEMIINYWYAGNGVILYDYIKYKKAIIPVPAYSPATEPVLEKEPVLLPNAVKPKYTIAEVPTCPFDFYAFEYDPGLLFAELFQVIIYGLA